MIFSKEPHSIKITVLSKICKYNSHALKATYLVILLNKTELCVWKSRIRSHAQVCPTPTKYTFLNSLSKILTWLLEIWNFVIFTRKRMQNDVHVKSNDPRAFKVCPTPTKYTFLNSLSIILTWLLEIWNFVIFTCKERKNDVHVKNNDQILFLLCSTPIN